jgi:hypothetical protein
MTHPSVHLQIASEDRPSIPNWFAELAIVAQVFITSGVLNKIEGTASLDGGEFDEPLANVFRAGFLLVRLYRRVLPPVDPHACVICQITNDVCQITCHAVKRLQRMVYCLPPLAGG